MLELIVHGPELDLRRKINAGHSELVLGRDPGCDIFLPDPHRSVSRRHLAVWNEGGELHFRVLSSVNGVETTFGETPPGTKSVLPIGQLLRLADYELMVERVPERPSPSQTDPWTVFDNEGSGTVALPISSLPPHSHVVPGDFKVTRSDEDPFGDWGFETTFGPGATGADARATDSGYQLSDLIPFFKGLGLELRECTLQGSDQLESMGKRVRTALLGLLELSELADAGRKNGHPHETAASTILRSDRFLDERLRYLLTGAVLPGAATSPDNELSDILTGLKMHLAAMAATMPQVIEANQCQLERRKGAAP